MLGYGSVLVAGLVEGEGPPEPAGTRPPWSGTEPARWQWRWGCRPLPSLAQVAPPSGVSQNSPKQQARPLAQQVLGHIEARQVIHPTLVPVELPFSFRKVSGVVAPPGSSQLDPGEPSSKC